MHNGPHHLVYKVIHVRRGDYAEPYRLRHREKRCPVDRLAVQLVLEREYPLVEPPVKRQVLTVASHQAHWRMPVRVIESRHEQLAPAVVSFKESLFVFRRLAVYVHDPVAVGAHVHVRPVFKILIYESDVFKKHFVTSLIQFIIDSLYGINGCFGIYLNSFNACADADPAIVRTASSPLSRPSGIS